MIGLLIVLCGLVPTMVISASCPSLQFPTVLAECQFQGRPLNCTHQPSPPGTRATFRCKPQHVIRAGYMRVSSYEVLCGDSGQWNDGPFRCVQAEQLDTKSKPPIAALPSPAVPAAPSCPALRSRTVLAECRLRGRPVDCMAQPAPPGTRAKFRCRPLHEFLFGFLPASNSEARCGQDGEWSVQPFRCVPICGQPTGKGTGLIRNGNVSTSAADFPWHVTIYNKTDAMRQICGGTLITTKYFVSAAHCFHNGKAEFPASIYMSGFGKIKRSVAIQEPTEQYRELSKIFIEGYKGQRELHSNDIALVELREDVDITSWTMPVCVDWGLELPDLRHGEKGAVVGFGNTKDRPLDDLRFALLPFVKSEECKKHVTDVLAVYNKLQDKFCIGFVNRTTVGLGDSGGGIAFPSDERVWFLRGVVSLGDSSRTTYSFFTNVTAFVPWMASLIQRGEVTGRRCGVDMSQAGGAASEKHDFPWDLDVFYRQTSNHDLERLQSGALIRPNLVITRAKTMSSTGQPVDLSEYPSTWLRVTSRGNTTLKDFEKTANVSEVVRAFFPSDVLAASGRLYNFILLELKQPLQLMPVCLDWSGTALVQKEHSGTAVLNVGQDNGKVWTRLPLLDAARCRQRMAPPPASHTVCTFQEGAVELRPHSSLYVFADNTWFLRGIGYQSAVSDGGTVSAFTDMADPGVQQWLSKTSDMIGKPTCGNLNLCEPLSAGLSLRGHLPWNVAVVVDNGAEGRSKGSQGSGILIQPNVVLTDSALLINTSGWDSTGRVPTVPTDAISVQWTSADGSVRSSQVVRVSVHENGQALVDGRPRVDVALLELRQAVFNTPVCLDLSGHVLQQMAAGQLGLVEAWSAWSPSNHSLVSVPYMGPTECAMQLSQSSIRSREANEFCTSAGPGILDPTVQGGGYLVSSGSQWFLQGLYTGYARFRERTVVLASDFREDTLKGWLRGQLKKIETVHSKSPEENSPKNCVGGRPSAAECGLFKSRDETQSEIDYIFKPSRNHMEWNVQVHLNRGKPLWEVRAGVLVRASMVLTTALDLFTSAETGETIPASDIIVKYLSADSRGPFSVEVQRIHLRESCMGCGPPAKRPWAPQRLHFDLALLELKTPVTLMPVCLPKLGRIASPLNEQTEGLVEVWQDAYSSQRTLKPTLYRTLGKCELEEYQRVPGVKPVFPPTDFVNAEFCVDKTSDEIALGAAYSVISSESVWHVLGLHGVDLHTSTNGTVIVFYDLELPGAREWLHKTTQMRASNESTDAPPNVPEPTSPTKPPAPPTPCGETKLPLYLLTNNHSLTGPLPWSVAVNVEDDEKVFNSGVLVRSDIVLTDASILTIPKSGSNDTGTVRTVHPNKVRVVWVSSTGRRHTSEVLAVHVRERDRDVLASERAFDVAMLRLKTPFPGSAVACLDQEELPKLKRYQIGVTDAWEISLLGFQSDVLATPYVNVMNDACIFMNTQIPRDTMTPERYCTGPVGVPVKSGAGFLVRKGSLWFLNGILSYHFANGDTRWVITDLDEEGVKEWIQQKLEIEAPDTTPRRPVKTSEPAKCGQTPLALSALAENATLVGHMPWSVIVYNRDSKDVVMQTAAGVLVQNDTVLTVAGMHVEAPGMGNKTGEVHIVDPSNTFVVWVSPSGRKRRSKVVAVHAHERAQGSRGFDVALLRLQTPFRDTSVACLDVGAAPPGPAPGQLGVMEAWNGDPFIRAHDAVAVPFEPNKKCRSEEGVTPDMFCSRGTREYPKPYRSGKMTLDIAGGTGFLVQKGDAWFLRGIVASYWPSENDRLAVTDLAEDGVREWLRERLEDRARTSH